MRRRWHNPSHGCDLRLADSMCHSVDPALGPADRFASVERLHLHPIRVQRFQLDWAGPVVVVAVHAHVSAATVVKRLQSTGCEVVAAIVLPCCGFEKTDPPPGLRVVRSHVDWGIWSPYRTVEVWRP